ncbi:hypothetical protein [Actinomadura spongiicola]|uniref:hypothetical protein n=1 Tax=Actinomadura spongiicola TaxID=2303421 RepID=UPI0011C0F8E5|nr:hypothetical protein [Actinomadura spongiicola]
MRRHYGPADTARSPDISPAHTPSLHQTLLFAALLISACGGNDDPVSLPSSRAPSPPAASTTVQDAVKHSYSQYWVVLPQAEQSARPQHRRELLGQYAAQPLLDDVLGNIEELHAKNLTSIGHIVVRIEKVQVKGNQATVWDCQNSTNAQLKNSRTGKITSRGTPNDHLRATLARGSDRQWRITRISPLGRC